jgi:hypothetical protein
MFYSGDHITELCDKCANTVWCVTNVYEDGSRELSSIHRNEQQALYSIEKTVHILDKLNKDSDKKLIKQTLASWQVL